LGEIPIRRRHKVEGYSGPPNTNVSAAARKKIAGAMGEMGSGEGLEEDSLTYLLFGGLENA
jgi:hypothetical protein